MNCNRCPHMKAIQAALAPCQTCDAGRLHGEVHVDGWSADRAHAQSVISDHTPSTGVTRLAADDEDRLRRSMATLFGMSDIDLLLVKHMMSGGSLAGYVDKLNALDRKIRSIRGNPRAFADAVKKRVVRIMPELRPVIQDLIDKQ